MCNQLVDFRSGGRPCRNSGDISNWDVSRAMDIRSMFENVVSFNGDLSRCDVSGVIDMSQTFSWPIAGWDVSSITGMAGMRDVFGR